MGSVTKRVQHYATYGKIIIVKRSIRMSHRVQDDLCDEVSRGNWKMRIATSL